jgi:hypothetical protein
MSGERSPGRETPPGNERCVMSGNKTPSASGRQLVSVTSKLAVEKAPGNREALWHKKVRLLVELGNVSAALEAAGDYSLEFPGEAAPGLVTADLLCRQGRWAEALSRFESARDIMVAGRMGPGARKLDLGPIFRLNEALGNAGACLRLSDGPESLASVLKARTWRRAGTASQLPAPHGDDPVAERLLQLERAWRGEGVRELPEIVEAWGKSEPEWRWRVLVEGLSLFHDFHLPITPWRKLQAEMSRGVVLDPRFKAERHSTSLPFSRNGHSGPGQASGPGGRSSLVSRQPGAS